MKCPKMSHWKESLRVVRYVKQAPSLGIMLKKGNVKNINVYCDSDWASCPNTKRSVIGYVVQLGEYLILWKSKKQ